MAAISSKSSVAKVNRELCIGGRAVSSWCSAVPLVAEFKVPVMSRILLEFFKADSSRGGFLSTWVTVPPSGDTPDSFGQWQLQKTVE